MKSLRWRMMTLLMIGSIINYLTRSTLGGAGNHADFDWFEDIERGLV